MKKNDLLVIGELNMDLILDDVHSFPELGKEKMAGGLNLTLGSSSAIFAANATRLGLSTNFCGMIGDDDLGRSVLRELTNFSVDTTRVISSSQYQTGLTAIIRHAGDRAMVTYPGAMEHFSMDDIPEGTFGQARHLHTSALFFQPGIKADLFPIIRKAKAKGMSVSVDSQWDPHERWDVDFKGLVAEIDFFLPNEDEFLNIAGAASLDEAIAIFRPHLSDGVIIVKQGTKGATVITKEKVQQIPGYLNKAPIDAIGAGDSFNAGVIYQFLQGNSIEQCTKFGNITGAVSTTASGGTAAIQSFEALRQTATDQLSITDINDFTR
ncbi:MAG TPA: carbohydrate kinase family protein [Fodinibius sp.]|nr:carbohydrate kinase family protein [Fodinibius sp.]